MLDGLMALSRRKFLQAGAVATIGAGFVRNSATPSGMTQTGAPSNPSLASVKALVFDTFGTVVDWRTSCHSLGVQWATPWR